MKIRLDPHQRPADKDFIVESTFPHIEVVTAAGTVWAIAEHGEGKGLEIRIGGLRTVGTASGPILIQPKENAILILPDLGG